MTATTVMMMMALVVSASTVKVSGELHRVGDKYGWSPNVNYSDWSKDHHFYVNDWLLFVFDKNLYNVLEVNESAYDSCNSHEFVRNITNGGRDVIQLKEAKHYYFLSGGGYCWGGMKLALLVEEQPHAPAAPPPAKNGSPSSSWTRDHFLLHFVCLMLGLLFIYLY